jgi:murein lipoprotein
MLLKLTKIFTLAFALILASGCVTTEQLNAVQASADKAQAAAEHAGGQANNAMNVASEAAYAASQAQADATAALECCNDNSARLDRMFEKAMMK